MRHGKRFNHLSRKAAHRNSMLANMACSLIEHKRINTTVAKAKALKQYIEPLVTKSKNDTTHSRRVVFSYLKQKEAVTELFREVSPKVADRPGGYTRIIRTGRRLGDNAEMCMIELVDFNEMYSAADKAKKKRSRRGRKKSSGAAATTAAAATAAATVVDNVEEATDVVDEAVEEVTEASEEVVEATVDAAEEATEAAEEAVEEATEEAAEEAKEEASDDSKGDEEE